ncbi:MAG: HAD-IA family hydrolase, partial [Bacteroidota bacterium]
MMKAILFGAIGAVAETSDIQRQSFNEAFKEADLDWNWSREAYQEMLTIMGGRNRIQQYANAQNAQLTEQQITDLHRRKTEIFQEKISQGNLPIRAGVQELIEEAKAKGIKVGFVTNTSNTTVDIIREKLGHPFDYVTDAAQVSENKPAPQVYELALKALGIQAEECVAIEDTEKSAQAAIRAGIATVMTPGALTQDQRTTDALAIVSDLGANA